MGPDLHPGSATRLTLKPATGSRGFVDGAWWPRSTNPTTEFTSLLTALMATSGPMTRLAYNLTAWDPAPRKLRVQGHQVRLEGFRTLDRRTIGLTDSSGHHVVLLLIPADTTELRGNAALARAAERHNVASPTELLADDPMPIEESSEARWETEGGHLLPA
ncbi:DUF5994 family protein [Saccharopolyspora endophytica]|uniref:Uncharacterized protein n=1 Tax=Saccharopolyspora endophytica TaxID=543886 RepID=A0ABS5DKW0_9PSEU|nr:DUF5994 family protein [Saccharopolyspora endophytica]MBQ0926923.1 hypothetical protein [Saccharopolyspora endophytica]